VVCEIGTLMKKIYAFHWVEFLFTDLKLAAKILPPRHISWEICRDAGWIQYLSSENNRIAL
ncbi:hypothetical protein NYY86_23130, partial [Acinetobacter baumannii]|nr:hypothetical protein [Acinetobacter baumannii]